MVKMFYLFVKGDPEKVFKLSHIQYNIHKRLKQFKYVSYARIDINFDTREINPRVLNADGRRADLVIDFPPAISESLESLPSILAIYDRVFMCLRHLWLIKSWNEEDLDRIYTDIKSENFQSSGTYGKSFSSPDNSKKAEIYCTLYPSHTDYYVRFLGRGKKLLKTIHFLKGFQDPFSVFTFYYDQKWKSNEHFTISFQNEITLNFYTDQDGVSISYNPISNTLEELKNYVAAYQAGVSLKEQARLFNQPY